jgi:exopolysaccharide biosynthesis protein
VSDYRNNRGGRSPGRGSYSRPGAQASNRNTSRNASGKKPLWFLVIADVLVLGLALNAFALIDNYSSPEASVKKLPTVKPTIAASATSSPTATPVLTTATQDNASQSESPTPQATPTIAVDQGLWGAKFPDKFTDGDVQKSDTIYKSHDIDITVSKETKDGVVYFVADIYVRNLENFKAAFSKDKYGPIEKIDNQAADRNAILAINGDNSANRKNRLGYEVRNGEEYHAVPYSDVLVMYQDGSMKTFSVKDFNYENEKSAGLWQVWSFGPMLLDGGGNTMTEFAPESIKGANNPRTTIGYFEPGHYCFVVVDGRQPGYSDPGMSMNELSQLMYSLGCKVAYNLDGGQSSIMYFNGKYANHPYNGGRSTADILYICEVK